MGAGPNRAGQPAVPRRHAVRLEPFLNQKHLKAENESRCPTQAFSCLKPARAQPTGGVVGSVRECALRHRQASHAYVRLCPRVVVHPLAPPGEQRLSSAVRERRPASKQTEQVIVTETSPATRFNGAPPFSPDVGERWETTGPCRGAFCIRT